MAAVGRWPRCRVLGLIVLLSLLMLAGCFGGARLFTVVVRVVAADDTPIAAASVTIGTVTKMTSQTGVVEFGGLRGTITIHVEKPGYLPAEQEVVVNAARNVTVELLDIPGISTAAREQLNGALEQWDQVMAGAAIELVSWTYLGVLETAAAVETARAEMTNKDQVYVGVGNPLDPASITAETLQAAPDDLVLEWHGFVDALLQVGVQKYQLQWGWSGTGDTFTTTAIGDEQGLLWDSLLMTLVYVEVHGESGGDVAQLTVRSGGTDIYWLWGSRRGEINWTISCGPPPPHPNCEFEVSAWMTLGDAKVEGHLVAAGDCCILYFGWAWRTPTGSIEMEWNPGTLRFDITVTGLGSSGQGNGSLICCP